MSCITDTDNFTLKRIFSAQYIWIYSGNQNLIFVYMFVYVCVYESVIKPCFSQWNERLSISQLSFAHVIAALLSRNVPYAISTKPFSFHFLPTLILYLALLTFTLNLNQTLQVLDMKCLLLRVSKWRIRKSFGVSIDLYGIPFLKRDFQQTQSTIDRDELVSQEISDSLSWCLRRFLHSCHSDRAQEPEYAYWGCF